MAKKKNKKSTEDVQAHDFTTTSLDAVDSLSPDETHKSPHTKKTGQPKKKNEQSTEDDEHNTTQTQSEKIDRELTEIYENADGSLPDMKSFEKGKGGRVLKAIITLVLSIAFLGSAAWYGYTKLFQHAGSFVEEDVILSIGGEEAVGFGEAVRYRVRYKNTQAVPLDNSVLEVRYPAGFVYESSSREPDTGTTNTWTLGPLAKNDGEYIDIDGYLYGDQGESQSFRVFLNYTPSNFSSTFQKVATQETHIEDAPVSVVLSGPESVSQGVTNTFTIDLAPVEDGPGTLPEHLALVFESSAAFVTQEMEPASEYKSEQLWPIDSITEPTTYTISGAFAGGEETLTPHAVLIGWRADQTKADAYRIADSEYSLTIAGQQLAVSLVANGSQSDITVKPGEDVSATVVVKNNTEETLSDVRVRMIFDAPSRNNASIMDWANLVDTENGAIQGEQISETIRRGQITWTGQNITELRSLKPGEQVAIDVTLPIKTSEDTDLSAYDAFNISLESDAQYEREGAQETAAAVPIVMTLNSDAHFEVRDDIDSDTHTITWFLTNSFHPLEDIEVKVDIYGDVSFDQEEATVPAGDITYNEEEQQLIWTVPNMPLSVQDLVMQFPVTLNKANESQTQLTSKVTVTAKDTVTGTSLLLIGDEIGL